MLRDCLLLIFGLWLLSYRIFIRTRCRFWVEVATQLSSGASLVLLTSELEWLIGGAAFPLLLVLGVLVGLAPAAMALAANIVLGSFLGALLWQLGICGVSAHLGMPGAHALVLTLTTLVFTLIFCTTAVGRVLWEPLVIPMLAASLVSSGIAGMMPLADLPLLGSDGVWAESPCAQTSAPLNTLCTWVVLTAYGVFFQALLLRRHVEQEEEQQTGPGGTLVSALLPDAMDEGGAKSIVPRPDQTGASRHNVITNAIFAPEGADQSHLTESERKLVEICRRDEEERDRVLWGGGLY